MSDKKASSVPKRLTKQLHRSRSVDRQKAARKRAIIRLFRKFDADKDGYLTKSELKEFMKSLGLETDSHTVHQFLKHFDLSKDARVTLKEFETVLDKMDKKLEKKQTGLRAIFDKYDKDNSGSIDRVEIKALLEGLGEHASPEAIQKLLAQFDKDITGDITFDEFERWVMYREHEAAEIKAFYHIFDTYDEDKDGHLSEKELEHLLLELGPRLSKVEAHQFAKELSDGGAGLSRKHFAATMNALHHRRETYEQTLSELFDEVDTNGSGTITANEVPLLLEKFGVKGTKKNVAKILEHYDADGDGELNYHEFRSMLRSMMAQDSHH